MKSKHRIVQWLALLALLSTINYQPSTLHAQGTAFTYQGQLQNNGGPASGTYNLTFALFNTNTGGVAIAGPVTNNGVVSTNGLFTVAMDFGSSVWNGQTNWLQIGVETNGGSSFTPLAPRQQPTPVPYAIYAESAGDVPGLVVQPNTNGAPNVIGGSPVNFVGSGVEGATIGGGGVTNYYGNAYPNSVTANFGTISGGALNTASGFSATLGGGWDNSVSGDYATVGGGVQNNASGFSATVSGGYINTVSGNYATVGGGYFNQATNNFATVPGGYYNLAAGQYSFAAGYYAQATNNGAFVWADAEGTPFSSITTNQFNVRANGGVRVVTSGAGMTLDGSPVLTTSSGSLGLTIQQNANGAPNVIAGSPVNFVAGGLVGATIGGGGATNYSGSAYTNSVTGNFGTLGGGGGNTASTYATAGGGLNNTASYVYATVGGGDYNTASGIDATVGGGGANTASSAFATVGGGYGNSATNNLATVPGGYDNVAGGQYSFAAGYYAQATNNGAFVWADGEGTPFSSTTTNQFSVRANGGVQFVTSGAGMTLDGAPVLTTGSGSLGLTIQQNTNGAPNVIAGSPVNFVASGLEGATIGGGGTTNYNGYAYTNSVTADFGTVSGGAQNQATNYSATVGGGEWNTAGGDWATVGGGSENTASGADATVGGGGGNVSGYYSTVGGGFANTATAPGGFATVPGGAFNVASGEYSFAAGYNANATNNGAFVWSDSSGVTTFSSANNQFVARASGGFIFYTSTGAEGVSGVSLAAGGGSWASLSDRNAKNNLTPVNSQTVLAQVAALPLTTWSYKTEPGVRHVGPMAQDFYTAFGVGEDDKHITEVDEGGVALAAIQGLNQKLEQKETEITELKARLEKLEQLIKAKNGGEK